MSNNLEVKIKDLIPAPELKDSAEYPISQEGVTYKVNQAQIEGKIVNKIGDRFIPLDQKGAVNGVAPLDENRKIPNENLTFGEVKVGDNNVVSGNSVNNFVGLKVEGATFLEAINNVNIVNRKERMTVIYNDRYYFFSGNISNWSSLVYWREIYINNDIYNFEGKYTLEDAIKSVPNSFRKSGLIITFRDYSTNQNVSYRYRLESTGNFNVSDFWDKIMTYNDVSNSINKSITKVINVVNNAIRVEYKDNTVFNTTEDWSIVLDVVLRKESTINDGDNNQFLLSKGSNSKANKGFIVYKIGNKVVGNFNDIALEAVVAENEEIKRIVFVKTEAKIQMYINGVLVSEKTTSFNIEINNIYKLQVGKWSSNQLGRNLDCGILNISTSIGKNNEVLKRLKPCDLIEDTLLYTSIYYDNVVKTAVNKDLKGLDVQRYGTLDNYYFSEKVFSSSTSVTENKIYPTVSEMYKDFPAVGSVGKLQLFRNTNRKSGNVLNDYDVQGDYKALERLKIVDKKTLTTQILAVDNQDICYGIQGNKVVRSKDVGATWEDLINISGANKLLFIYALNNGELLILDETIRDDSNLVNDKLGGIWVTTNGKTNVKKVLTLRNRYQTFQPSWSIEIVDSIIYYSEYGNSYNTQGYDPTWNLGAKADATRIFKSENYGESFSQFVNLNELTDLYPANGGLHIHAVHWDKYWNRLWVTSGDGGGMAKSNKKLAWTDDGVKWDGIDLSNYFDGGYAGAARTPYYNLQGLSMYSTNNSLLLGSDNWHNAIFRVNKLDRNNVELEVAYETSEIKTDVVYFTGRIKKLTNSPILIQLARGDSATQEGRDNQKPKILATYNGVDFMQVWEDLSVNQASDFYFNFFEINGGNYFTYLNYIVKFK